MSDIILGKMIDGFDRVFFVYTMVMMYVFTVFYCK